MGVGDAVGDVGEVGSASADAAGGVDGFLDGQVGEVFAVLEAVEDEDVEAVEQFVGGLGDLADIGAVGEVADAESEAHHGAVDEGDGGPAGAADFEGAVDQSGEKLRAEQADFGGLLGEGVVEAALEGLVGVGVGPDVEGAALDRVEAADVVEAHDVVGMGVGVDDGVDSLDVVGVVSMRTRVWP